MVMNDTRTRLSVTGLLQVEFVFLVILVYWLFDVTVDDISVIYTCMMAHRSAGGLKRPVLVLGLQKLFGS